MADINTQVNTVEALAVVLYAFRCNTKVVKVDDREGLTPNIKYLLNYFSDTESDKITLTTELKQEAENLRTWYQHSTTMSLLTNGHINDFQKSIAELVAKDTVNPARFGVLVWAPKLYSDQQARDDVREKIMHIGYRSKHIGKEKQKIIVNFTLLEKRWHRDYNIWTAFGHDEHNNLVRFMSKHEDRCATGQIQGRVKQHRNEFYHGGACVTVLNFVKAI